MNSLLDALPVILAVILAALELLRMGTVRDAIQVLEAALADRERRRPQRKPANAKD
jgi:hypothetical protein